MNKIKICTIAALLFSSSMLAQENVYPAPAAKETIVINGGNIHVGNGEVFKGSIKIKDGKIIEVSKTGNLTGDKIIDATNKEVYPGLIAASTTLGLVEVSSVRATQDYRELGEINPSIKSISAYNTDSKVINTLRSNGILLAHIVPTGGVISGTSTLVQLDAWSVEDAAYKTNNGVHFYFPALINFPSFGNSNAPRIDAVKRGLERIEEIRKFFTEAKAYLNGTPKETNLKYESVRDLFNQKQTLFIHCDLVKEMLMAIEFAKEFNFKLCLVGASDSWIIADLIKKNNVSVILSEPHSLPNSEDDDVDQPYKTAAALQQAGVTYTICQEAGDGFWQQRNLPFQAGTMATYGLTKEQALQALTLNAATILNVANKTGSIEVGKDANIVVSTGDILDMKSSVVTDAFIQGRAINLDNKHTQLYKKYQYKYGTK